MDCETRRGSVYVSLDRLVETRPSGSELTVFSVPFLSPSIWNELAFLLHPRENTLVTLAFQQFAREEATYSQAVEGVWRRLEAGIESMPLE